MHRDQPGKTGHAKGAPLEPTSRVRKPRLDRDDTDKSLRVERDTTDTELAARHKALSDEGDKVLKAARRGAAAVVDRARAKADERSGDMKKSAGHQAVVEDRAREDAVLRAEYRTADAQSCREREDASARSALLELERVATDQRLGVERARADDTLASREDSLRRSEEQLRQAQKMEAIGRLAGGVAHDFNNILCVIMSYASMAMETLPSGDPLREDIHEIEIAGRRATELTSQLLTFSRQQVLEPKVVDLNESLAKMEKMLRRILREDVALQSNLEPSLWRVHADPTQIDQVVMNLVVNARDAMPAGGKVTLATANVDLDEQYALEHPGTKPGPHVMLEVSDSGVGMDAPTRARIFEPFFTTKEIGKGTGLGLSTVFGIVQQSDASITVESEPGRGATFRVYFPRCDRAPQTASEAPPVTPRSLERETVLFAEDDAQLRHLVKEILSRKGFDVLLAASPSEALRISKTHTGRIHLLLTDMVMPEMNGRRLAERVRAYRPEIKVVYMSGYTGDVLTQHGGAGASVAFLQKPITPAGLLEKIREALLAK